MQGDVDGSAAALWRLAGLGFPMAIRVAATLRVADHVENGVRTIEALAEACGADQDALDRLVHYLCARDVLAMDSEGVLSVPALGRPLLSDHPAHVRQWLDVETGGRGELAYFGLLHSIRTGQAAFPVVYGKDFWSDVQESPERVEAFNQLLGYDVDARGPSLAEDLDWSRFERVLDVGGGDGSLLQHILQRHDHISGAVYDLPGACASAEETFHRSGLDGRAWTVQGSFFDPIPAGYDVYVLSLVLHDWNDEDTVRILQRCREAAGAHGRILVIETMSRQRVHTGMDLRMMVIYGARERDAEDLRRLADQAGLEVSTVEESGQSTVVELVSAPAAELVGSGAGATLP